MRKVVGIFTGFILITLSGLSAAERVIYDLSTPQTAWISVLQALQSGKPTEVKQVTTAEGFNSLAASASSEEISQRFSKLGAGWKSWEVRWQKQNSVQANALLGPAIKEHGLEFIHTKRGWKLNRWQPGE